MKKLKLKKLPDRYWWENTKWGWVIKMKFMNGGLVIAGPDYDQGKVQEEFFRVN